MAARAHWLPASVSLLLAVLAGCTDVPDGEVSSPTAQDERVAREPAAPWGAGGVRDVVSGAPSAHEAVDAVPDWFADREPMPSCGRLGPGDIRFDNDGLVEANDCFLDAFRSGEPAELEYTQLSEEGDPGTDIYRVLGQGELEMLLDRRQDQYGNLDFGHLVCTDLAEGELTVSPMSCKVSNSRRVPPLQH